MGNSIRQEGLRTYLWEYPGRKKSIEQHGACLVEVLNAIARDFPGEPIHFVSHSLGGLIVRAAVSHPECPAEAKMGRAVLLAPPNKGAVLARTFKGCPVIRGIFGKRAGNQLMTYQEAEMNRIGTFPEEMEVMVVAGSKESPLFKHLVKEPNDGKVTIEETKLPTPHTHHTLPVSHSWIMTSRQSIALTKQFLLQQKPNPHVPRHSVSEKK